MKKFVTIAIGIIVAMAILLLVGSIINFSEGDIVNGCCNLIWIAYSVMLAKNIFSYVDLREEFLKECDEHFQTLNQAGEIINENTELKKEKVELQLEIARLKAINELNEQ